MLYQPISLIEISNQLQNDEIDLLEFINALCDKIELVDPQVHSLIPEKSRRERLLLDAKKLLKQYPDKKNRPPLFGVPVGIKDLFRVDGFETRCGSNLPAELFSGKEASSVTKLKNSGALILGKTVTTEFAYFEPGPTRNPNNTEYTPGGSSSGSAAAVAAGLTSFALGTQTIGSIIRPAAYCGVVGFKPSFGRIAIDGVIPFSNSIDQVGFFAKNLCDCNCAATILCDNWDANIFTQQIKSPLTIGIPEDNYLAQAADDILTNFENFLKYIQSKVIIKRVKLFDNIDEINKTHRIMIAAEIANVHKNWYKQYKNLYRKKTTEIIEEGLKISDSELAKAKNVRFTLRTEIESAKIKSGIDLWISPATCTMPPKGLASTGSPLMSLPWTYAGLPSIAVPFNRINGLPTSIQFCGSFNYDELLLKHCKLF